MLILSTSLSDLIWSRPRAPLLYGTISTIAYMKAGRVDDASELLDLAHKRLNARAWPYPIVAYLRKEISKDALLSSTTDNDKMTEARPYSLLFGEPS